MTWDKKAPTPPSCRSRGRKHKISGHLSASMLQAPSCHKHNKAAGWHWQRHRAPCTGDQLPPSHCPGAGAHAERLPSFLCAKASWIQGCGGSSGETTLFCATPVVDGLRMDECQGCALVPVRRCLIFGERSPLGKESRPYPCVTPSVWCNRMPEDVSLRFSALKLNRHVYNGNKKQSAAVVEVCGNSYGRNLQSWLDFLGIFGNPVIALWFFFHNL